MSVGEWVAPIALAVLALVDAAFAGFRDAAGRNPRIRKLGYFRRALRRGLRAGAVSCATVAIVVVVLIARARAPAEVYAALAEAATLWLWPLGVYATLVLLALGVWLSAEPDIRVLASVIVLGPFTLVRPWLIAGSCVWVVTASGSVEAVLASIAAAAAQLTIEPWLAHGWRAGMPAALVAHARRAR